MEIARKKQVDKKFHVMFALNFNGLHYYKVLNRGETVNSESYTDFLQEALTSFQTYTLVQQRRSVPWELCKLMQDNAPPHCSAHTRAFLEKKHCTLVKQAPYSPDLNLCDRTIFPKLEMRRSRVTFNSEKELRDFLDQELFTLTPDVMAHEFTMLLTHMQKVIGNDGNYVQYV